MSLGKFSTTANRAYEKISIGDFTGCCRSTDLILICSSEGQYSLPGSGLINNIVTVVVSDVSVVYYTFRASKPLFHLDLKTAFLYLGTIKSLFCKFT